MEPPAATPRSGGSPATSGHDAGESGGGDPGLLLPEDLDTDRVREGAPVTLRISGWSLVRAVIVVASGLVALRVVMAASTVLWWLAIATVVAGAFHPAVLWLRRWMPMWAAIVAVITVGLGFTIFVGYRGVAELADQYQVIRANALDAARSLEESRQFGDVATEFGLVDKTTSFVDNLPAALAGGGGDGGAAATVQTAASSGSALFAIATFAVLMLIFGARFVEAGLAQIDDLVVRHQVGILVTGSYHAAYRYVWLMAARAVLIGVGGGLLCLALHLDTPTALGVGIAGLSLIPGLGIVLAAIPVAVYVAITTPATAVVIVAAAVLLQATEAALVQRRINDASVQVGPTATLVAVLLGLQLYGLGGALVGLATAVFGLAVLRRLSEAHDEVFTAVRQLVREQRAASGDEDARDESP